MIGIGHGNRQRDEPGHRLDVTYGDPNVSPPHIDHGSASTVIAGVHAEIVLLPESGTQWEHPVGAFLVGAALVRPEGRAVSCRGRSQPILMVGPSANGEWCGALVRVFDVEDCNRRKVFVDGDRYFLLQTSRRAG